MSTSCPCTSNLFGEVIWPIIRLVRRAWPANHPRKIAKDLVLFQLRFCEEAKAPLWVRSQQGSHYLRQELVCMGVGELVLGRDPGRRRV